MKEAHLLNMVLALLLILMFGWLLLVGRGILLPIITAILSVYIMISATYAVRRLPGFRALPDFTVRLIVLSLFATTFLALALVVARTVQDIASAAPVYQANFEKLIEQAAARFDVETQKIWDDIEAVTIAHIDIQRLVIRLLGGFTSVGASVFLILIYAVFLFAERETFERRIAIASRDAAKKEKTLRIISNINKKIREYLAVKTLLNVILGTISYVILWAMGIDFALFWAVLIALLNYVPYIGSYLAVSFPVILSIAQYADTAKTLTLTGLLIVAQVFVGNLLEPRLIGRQLNLSPFVVLVALAVWTSLWGIPGAILAIPMTSMLMIVLASFDETRPFAIMLVERPDDA